MYSSFFFIFVLLFRQMKDAEETEKNANEALNISREALKTTRDLLQFPDNLANEISRLNSM